jgi:hypothetical protein
MKFVSQCVAVKKSTKNYEQEIENAYDLKLLRRFGTQNAIGSNKGLQRLLSPLHGSLSEMLNTIYTDGLDWKGPARLGVSSLQILEIMDVDETTKAGNAQCVVTILDAIGSLELNDRGSDTIKATLITERRRLLVYGDQLSMKHVQSMKEDVLKKSIETDHPESHYAVLEALDTILLILGDLHVEMHTLAGIYLFAYGGCLQPIQHALGWTRIQRNTIPRHNQSIHQVAGCQAYCDAEVGLQDRARRQPHVSI